MGGLRFKVQGLKFKISPAGGGLRGWSLEFKIPLPSVSTDGENI